MGVLENPFAITSMDYLKQFVGALIHQNAENKYPHRSPVTISYFQFDHLRGYD